MPEIFNTGFHPTDSFPAIHLCLECSSRAAAPEICTWPEMEYSLRCNSLKCRVELSDRALVTTCSHIFCVDCWTSFGAAADNSENHASCPACGTRLVNPDDAVITNLNPSEDYKTSVLSGLSPGCIMECASRALSFWVYQTGQEIVYQSHMYRALSDRFTALNVRLEKTVNEANSEIEALRRQVKTITEDNENLHQKHEDLTTTLKEKSRKLLQTQELYDKVKRKVELGQMQMAANSAVDSAVNVTSSMREDVTSQSRHGFRCASHITGVPLATHVRPGPNNYNLPTRGLPEQGSRWPWEEHTARIPQSTSTFSNRREIGGGKDPSSRMVPPHHPLDGPFRLRGSGSGILASNTTGASFECSPATITSIETAGVHRPVPRFGPNGELLWRPPGRGSTF